MSEIKAVLFDLDNTLYPTKQLYDGGLRVMFLYLQTEKLFSWTWEEFYTINLQVREELEILYGKSPLSQERIIRIKKILQKLDISYDIKFLQKMYKIYSDYLFANIQIEEWVVELLENLKNKNIKLAIISDGNTDRKIQKLEKLKLIDYFDTIVCSDMLWVSKPSSEPFLETLNDLWLTTDEVLYIWDNPVNDIIGANNMGIASIRFDRGEKKMLNFSKPTYLVKNIQELQNLLITIL